MHVWLIQRAESTPHDEDGNRRIQRTGMIAEVLARRGHQVIWWTSSFDHVGKKQRVSRSVRKPTKSGYQIHYLRTLGYKKNISIQRLRDNNSLSRTLATEMRLEAKVPDLILASIPSVELALEAAHFAKDQKIPIILDVRDLYPDVFRDMVGALVRPLVDIAFFPMRMRLRKLCRNAIAIIGNTDAFVDWGVSFANRKRGPNDLAFHMAYIPDKSSNEADFQFWLNRPLGQKHDHLQVIFLGNITNCFNFEPVFEAARALQGNGAKVQFTFCGNGFNSKNIQLVCKNLDNCDFVGWIDTPQIQSALKLADVGLAPYIDSLNFSNNIPNKPAEYMSGGLAVLSSLDHGPLAEILSSSGVGEVYNGAFELEEILNNLICNPDKLKKLQSAAKILFLERFNAEVVYEKLVDYLEDMNDNNQYN